MPPSKPTVCTRPFEFARISELISSNNAPERETLIGFTCGHVFHLSHLHSDASRPQSDTGSPERHADRTPRASSPLIEDSSVTASRIVGRKVLTARLLRDKIGDGCRICALTRKIESLGSESEA